MTERDHPPPPPVTRRAEIEQARRTSAVHRFRGQLARDDAGETLVKAMAESIRRLLRGG